VTAGSATFSFELHAIDPRSWARRGTITTMRGVIETPAFMPVGTQAAVKTLSPHEVAGTGAQIILANTYHLMLRPGAELIADAGGLQRFMAWDRPMLTDSGGFQVFSLAAQARVSEEGVRFRAHTDGSPHTMTPESVVDLQLAFGSDIMMPLDHLLGLPATVAELRVAADRTHRWLNRAILAHRERNGLAGGSALFGICQGGIDPGLRRESAAFVASTDVAGCAIGGLSVGESKAEMTDAIEIVAPLLPAHKPRYLMGVGSPEDLWNGVERGVDLFDCVLPTRLARNAALFTPDGRLNLRSARYRHEHRSLDPTCDCELCTRYTMAYLHHLFRSGEVLALRLASVHNLRFLARQMEAMRVSIEEGTFMTAKATFDGRYRPVGFVAPVDTE
jgi:queuine tRNA-ribosyltransferase